MIREKYCVDSETKYKQKGNNWDLAASENGADRILFYRRQRLFEWAFVSLLWGGGVQLLRSEIHALHSWASVHNCTHTHVARCPL